MPSDSMLLVVLYVAAGLLSLLLSLMVVYLVLRQAIFHAMRAHTRWIDDGKP